MTNALPVIDLAAGDDESVAAQIGAACCEVGFFYMINHGVEPALIAEVFAEAKRFFALPLEEKRAIAIEKVRGNRGYSGLMHEALDPSRGPDMKEAFNVGLALKPDDPDLLAGKPFPAPNAWPDLPGFRETLLAYFDACMDLGAHPPRPRVRSRPRLGFLRRQV